MSAPEAKAEGPRKGCCDGCSATAVEATPGTADAAAGSSRGGRGGRGGGGGGVGGEVPKYHRHVPRSHQAVAPAVYPLQAGLIDIGVNLTDAMYTGHYNHGRTPAHPSDLDDVVDRAATAGVVGLIVTGGNLPESKHAIELAVSQNRRLRLKHAPNPPPVRLFATVGCHPTRSNELVKYAEGGPTAYIAALRALIETHRAAGADSSLLPTAAAPTTAASTAPTTSNGVDAMDDAADHRVVVALGEFGLDYDRLHFSGKDDQRVAFAAQLDLAADLQLPLFLHNRNTGGDFAAALKAHPKAAACGGVVHSFTGDAAELAEMLDLGMDVGLNGCSFKTADNLAVARTVPLDRLHLETDAPWCDIRRTHDSFALLEQSPASTAMQLMFPKTCKKEKFEVGALVKGRNEPATMIEVAEVAFRLREAEVRDREHFAAIVRANTERVFRLVARRK